MNFPASDGGDGFVDALAHHTGGELVECDVADPLGRRRIAPRLAGLIRKYLPAGRVSS